MSELSEINAKLKDIADRLGNVERWKEANELASVTRLSYCDKIIIGTSWTDADEGNGVSEKLTFTEPAPEVAELIQAFSICDEGQLIRNGVPGVYHLRSAKLAVIVAALEQYRP